MSVEHSDPMASCLTLFDLARWRGIHQPGRRAFTFLLDGGDKEAHITYKELDRRARAIGALLQRQAGAGERALLLYPPGLEYITAFFGCLYAAVIAVPVYPPNPARLERTLPRLRSIALDSRPTVVLTTSSILPIATTLAAQDPAFATTTWLATDSLTGEEAAAWRAPAVGSDTLAFLQYTSGSTATPRGVMVGHANLMHNESLIRRAFALTEQSVGVSWLPLYHDMGLIGNVLQPLYTGFPCVLMSPADFLQKPVRWLRAIARYHATASGGPNFAYDLCINQVTPEQCAALDLRSWKVAFNGAEPIRPETLERFAVLFEPCGFRREAFFPCYGLAEATLLVSGGPTPARPVLVHAQKSALERKQVKLTSGEEQGRTSTLVGSGQVLSDQRVLIVDPQTRTSCQPGQIGEIWVAGPGVAQGYWNSPQETGETFRARLADSDEGPFLRTGDLGFLQDGQLVVTSRLKDLIIIRGRNHAPQDIERTVEASHPALRPGCGVAFSVDVQGEEQLAVVYEVRRQYLSAESEEVAAAIRQAVAEQHELHVYAVVFLKTGTLPKTSSGKLQRRACRDEFLRGSLQQIGASILTRQREEEDGAEESAGAVLASLLEAEQAQRLPLLAAYLQKQVARAAGVPPSQVNADQPFMALGLDSLRMLELKQRIEMELDVEMSLERFIEYPTITRLAAVMLDALEQRVGALWVEISRLTDEEVDVRLAQLVVKER